MRVFNRTADPRVRGLAAWTGGGWLVMDRDITEASRSAPDPRVTHAWDAKRALTRAYRRTLGTDRDPWDVYLLYGPGARWSGADPPAPDFWMQRLGLPQAPVFDPGTFADSVLAKLARLPAPNATRGPRRVA